MNAASDNYSLGSDKNIELLSAERNLEIGYHLVEKYLHCHWSGFQNKGTIQYSGALILNFLKKKKTSRVLNDNSQVTGPWHEAANWTVREWFPQMEMAGLKYFAWVLSPDIYAQLSARKAMPASEVVKTFKDLDSAREWLHRVR